ncbi:MAG: hypothetical protein Q4C55_05575 [Eubacterium sp.]|nr:hypothetical protein [Eubacterium sp.]
MTKAKNTILLFTALFLLKGAFDLVAGFAMTAGSLLFFAEGTPDISSYTDLLHLLGVSEAAGHLPAFLGIPMILCGLFTLTISLRALKKPLGTAEKSLTLPDALILLAGNLIAFAAGFFSFTAISLVTVEAAGLLLALIFAILLFRRTRKGEASVH